jgi:Fe2+ transport system protein FeoA
MKRLHDVRPGHLARIISICGGGECGRRLADLGIIEGEKIKMLHNTGVGPVTVAVKGSKLSLGHGLAMKIAVKEEE